jgi:Maltokinase N-terminal cap domain
MAIIHMTTLTPTKLELLSGWLPSQPWYLESGDAPALVKAGGFRLDDPDGAVGIELMVVTDSGGGQPVAYHVPLTYRGEPLDGGGSALIGTTEHGVLGTRWVYDATRDPVFAEQIVALIQGTAQPQAQSLSNTPDHTVLTRPASPGKLEPGAFSAADGADGTRLTFDTGGAGQLSVHVMRVLDAEAEPGAPAAGTGLGYVTAQWQSSDSTMTRSVFAIAEAS